MNHPSSDTPPRRGFFRSLGPTIIVASVVLGPGSILTSSKVGCQYGYSMIWILAGTCILMVGMVTLGARLGVSLQGTLCDELTRRVGRPLAALAGVSLFLIATCFQFGNNLGVLAAIEPFVESTGYWPVLVLLLMNGIIIVALFGLKRLYNPLERLMMILVLLMLAAFAGNLLFAMPSVVDVLGGLIPQISTTAAQGLVPHIEQGKVLDPLGALVGLIATTFSVGGAFYQAYLVREKGWTSTNLRQGLTDSVVGIMVLGGISLMIMITSAAVLHGKIEPSELKSVAHVARQLQPLFGSAATTLFCLGIFAGAFSSFMVNAMIGGTLMSDGLGLGGRMDQRWPRLFTVAALTIGMIVAIAVKGAEMNPVPLIIFAQALTVLGVPVLALSMLYLATRPVMSGPRKVPVWILVTSTLGCALVLVLAARTAWTVYLKLTISAGL